MSRKYFAAILIPLLVILFGAYAWAVQLRTGMGVTGLQRPVFWGFYIVDFVFWIGISHAGTLISAILRLTDAGWRKPITRAAEAITVFALMIGGMFPDHPPGPRLVFLLADSLSELAAALAEFPLAAAVGSDRDPHLRHRQRHLSLPAADSRYGAARRAQRALAAKTLSQRSRSAGPAATREWHALERAMKLMAGIILAVAISVHTVVAWDFAMAIAPMWHSTIFGPYFVVGAIFSGLAALMIVMALIRKLMGLELYLTRHHFDNLAKLLLLMSVLWLYFTLAEHLTVWYGNDPSEMAVFGARTRGRFCVPVLDRW